MKTLFVAHAGDAVGCLALRRLSGCGEKTMLLQNGQSAPPTAICIFGFEGDVRNRFLRLSGNRMEEEGIVAPEWCKPNPFLVAVSAPNARVNPRGLEVALLEMATRYEKWGSWMKRPEAPWNPDWRDGKPHESFASWHAKAEGVLNGTPAVERLLHRVAPIFQSQGVAQVTQLVVTGCALFNKPHTDVVDALPKEKKRMVLDTLAPVLQESGVMDIRFIVPRGDLVCEVLRDHFHPFMFMGLGEVGAHLGTAIGHMPRLFGAEHSHARSDAEVARALDRSGDGLVREIVEPLCAESGTDVKETTWTGYIGNYIGHAHTLALKYQSVAEEIYMERVETRPSYQSLHKIDPVRGLRRTIANNVFYIAEAMYLRDNPGTAVINCEYADTFWKGLEPVLEKEVWGSFRPLIGMVPEPARQPWSY